METAVVVGINGAGIIPIGNILNTMLADNGGPTNTHALVLASLAIDSGNNGEVPFFADQRGFQRIVDGTVDIGAVEGIGGGVFGLVVTSNLDTVDPNDEGTTLREAIFVTYDGDAGPVRRIEAERAQLQDGSWVLSNAKIWPLRNGETSEALSEFAAEFELPDFGIA